MTARILPFRCGDIGEGQREIEVVPLDEPREQPVVEPAAPVEEPEKVPA